MFKRLAVFMVLIGAMFLVFAQVALAQEVPPEEEPITDLLMWSTLVGFFLPPVLSVIMQSGWSDRVRAVIAFLACLIAGAGTAYFEDDLTGRTWVSSALVVLVSALATYRNFWRPTGVSPAIERATTFGRSE